jgi:hypothetical protein
MTDNRDIYFSYVDVSSQMSDASNWVRTNLVNPTALNSYYTADHTELTDMLARDQYYTDYCETQLGQRWTTDGHLGLQGFATCNTVSPSGRCEQGTYRISRYVWDNRTIQYRRTIACHEIGHLIGLKHRSGSLGCMPGNRDGLPAYTTHDRAHFTEFSNAAS